MTLKADDPMCAKRANSLDSQRVDVSREYISVQVRKSQDLKHDENNVAGGETDSKI